ncbi:MAG: hypothetical protein WAO55_05470 [Candidatus Manganitrophaceae bacterium]
MRRWGNVFLIILIGVMIGSLEGQGKEEKKMEKEGEKRAAEEVRTERIGRFAIDLPAVMHRAGQEFELRGTDFKEIVWLEAGSHEEAKRKVWEDRLLEINKKKPPRGKERVLIETRDLPRIGTWAKGVLYYGSYMADDEAYWDILLDGGPVGVW